MNDRPSTMLTIAAAALLVGTVVGAGAVGLIDAPGSNEDVRPTDPGEDWPDDPGFETFESAAAFQSYFEAADRHGNYWQGSPVQRTDGGDDGVEEAPDEDTATEMAETTTPMATAEPEEENADAGDDGSERHSETNVQEGGIDEPDVLKTDGDSVYYSGFHFQRGAHETTVLDVDDPAEPAVVATIPAAGELLLVPETDTLVVFGDERLWGFDVSDPSDPEQVWTERVDAHLTAARLQDGSLYLVLVDRPARDDPCPLTPFGDDPIECTDVYRPNEHADADVVYTAARVNPATGAMEDETSVVGSARDSATYVSENAIYLSYTRSTTDYDLQVAYLTGPGSDHLDPATAERIENLQTMDISDRAKTVELGEIVESWLESLPDDERRAKEEALREGLEEYVEDHQRDLTKTGVVRVSTDGDLDVTATGEVPGYPLNQWSMDEHEGHLRIATTIPGVHGTDSENDVYVLDGDLEVTGSVEGLGVTERIYSVRFEGDEGYVVTFREIDPFYTLDLSDPANPRMEGELKIPGFSNYLHPLDAEGDLVLGVGQEDRKLKLSLFDVSDRENPAEVDVRVFEDEHFSEANRNHRAFLHDPRHGVFFLPAGEYSYVFSYEGGELEEVARVDAGGPGVRAMYVDDYLYVFGSEEIVVFDETTWEEVARVDSR